VPHTFALFANVWALRASVYSRVRIISVGTNGQGSDQWSLFVISIHPGGDGTHTSQNARCVGHPAFGTLQMKIVSQRREQAKSVYNHRDFEVKKEIPEKMPRRKPTSNVAKGTPNATAKQQGEGWASPLGSRSVWKRIAVGILASGVTVSSWYIKDCLADRKKAINDFQESVGLRESSLERMAQDNASALAAQIDMGRILQTSNPSITVLKQQHDGLLALTRTSYDDCNNFKEAFYRYEATRRTVERLFLLPSREWPDISEMCSGNADLQRRIMGDDLERLATDKDYRHSFLGSENVNDLSETRLAKSLTESVLRYVIPQLAAEDERLLKTAESSSSHFVGSCFDCLKQMLA